MKKKLSSLMNLNSSHPIYYFNGSLLIAVPSITQAVVFLGKCVRTAAKTMIMDRKKPEGTSSAIFRIGNVVKYCELKRCADPARRTEPTTKMKS